MGGARVLLRAVIGGEAAVDEQREFRDGRLNSASLKQQTAAFGSDTRSSDGTPRPPGPHLTDPLGKLNPAGPTSDLVLTC